MGKTEDKKQQITQQVIAHLLNQGLSDNGIRALAQAAGTSDRMLIYYFGTKDALINESLQFISAGMAEQLDALLGSHRRTAAQLLAEVTTATSSAMFLPMVQLWFEIVGLAARGQEPYATNAVIIANNWIDWIEAKLEQPEPDQAAELFAQVEGRLLLRVIGYPVNSDDPLEPAD
ncbi:MAG: TetR/AcrR family transcriptional regulator [Cyanobacteria bacterium]|nr:TetR/AcrR family transcriptional regulator [Cyanobacteriota bacterium]MDA0865564.1 TetR/AcrR family transcriptional regulator [Cyanobacteriota bacterium]